MTRTFLPPSAIFNIPLVPDQPLAPDQALAISLAAQASWTTTTTPRSRYGPPYNVTVEVGRYSSPIWTVPSDTPRVKVFSVKPRRNLQPILDLGVPVAQGVTAAGGTDGSLVIACDLERWEFYQWRAASPANAANGYVWECSQGGYIQDVTAYSPSPAGRAELGTYRGGYYGANWGWGVSASGASLLGGRLMAEDFYWGSINHALALALPATAPSQVALAPATRHDYFNMTASPDALVDPYRIPEGAWFRLPANFDPVSWARTHHGHASQQVVEMAARACRDYGVVIVDSASALSFAAEASLAYGTPYHPFTAAQQPPWGHFGCDLPWDQFVQIAPRAA